MKIFILLASVIIFAGCTQSYYLNKAIKKGYQPAVYDTIKINTIDSFPVIIHDSIVWEKFITTKDTIIQVQTQYLTKTRFIQRMDLKRFNDSLQHLRSIYTDSLRNALKTQRKAIKTDLKQQRVKKGKTFTDTIKFTAVSLFFLLIIIVLFKLKQYFKID